MPEGSPRDAIPERRSGFLLSAVSGFVDTAGFLLLTGIFTAHVTGNFILAGAALAGIQDDVIITRLLMLPVFMVGAGLAYRVGRRGALRRVLWLELGCLIVFGVSGWLLDPGVDSAWRQLPLFAVAAPAVLAMGCQNTLNRELLSMLLPTTMMTGNTTQFTIDVTRWLISPGERRALNVRLARFGTVLVGFFVGAAAGALTAGAVRFACVVVPVLTVGYLILRLPARREVPV